MACLVHNPQILYQTGDFHVLREKFGKSEGFAVYEHKGTHSVRVARIGYSGDKGLQKAIAEADRRAGTKQNPIFLPKSLFDSYVVKSDGGEVVVDRIQTLNGAERKVKELARKYPCVGFLISSAKHGGVIKHYAASVEHGTPKVDKDNSREYKREATQEARDSVRFRLFVNGQEYADYETKQEAEKVGKKEAGDGGKWKVKQVAANPVEIFQTQSEARRFASRVVGATVRQALSGGWVVLYPVGSRVRNRMSGIPSHDIPMEMHHGYPQRRAVAMALSEQRRRENPVRDDWSGASPYRVEVVYLKGHEEIRNDPYEYADSKVEANKYFQRALRVATGEFADDYGQDKIWVRVVERGTMRPIKFKSLEVKKHNPSEEDAAAMFKTFHGEPSEETLEYYVEEFERTNWAVLGDLVQLKVETTTGKLVELNAPDPERSTSEQVIKLVSSPDGKQLAFVGGDEAIDVKSIGFTDKDIRDLMVIGLVCEFTYRTQKAFDNFETTDYYHEAGEDTPVRKVFDDFRRKPSLLYCPHDETMKLAGGLYQVKDVGVVN